MKKYRKIIIFLLVIMTIISCNSFINEEPVSKLSSDNMWKGLRDAQAGVAGIYTSFRQTMLYNYWFWGEFRADNFQPINETGTEATKLMQNAVDATMDCSLWTNLYQTINAANAAIKYIPQCEITDAVMKADLLGQAYAMRALCYFYAVRVWGAVPVYLTPTESFDNLPVSKRISRDSVLRQVIIPDLEMAEENVSKLNMSRKEISILAVYAIRADVDLWLEEWQDAVDYCDKFIFWASAQSPYDGAWGRCQFETSFQTLTNILSKGIDYTPSDLDYKIDDYGGMNELIFVIPFYLKEWNQPSLIGVNFGGNQLPTGGGLYSLTQSFVNSFATQDTLRRKWIVGVSTAKNNLAKFVVLGTVIPYGSLYNCQQSYPIYRATEMLLIKAEALANLKRYSESLEMIRVILKRAGIENLVKKQSDFTVLPDDLIDYIQQQKRIELVGEGKRFFDLQRTGLWNKYLGVNSDYTGNKIDDVRKMLFPINYIHINQGRGLIEQNWSY